MCVPVLITDLDFYVGLPQTEQHRAARVRGHGFSVVFEILFAPIELLSTLVAYTKSTTFTEINSVSTLKFSPKSPNKMGNQPDLAEMNRLLCNVL